MTTITGTHGADNLFAIGEGVTEVRGLGGDDYIVSGENGLTVKAGSDDDVVEAHGDDSRVYGQGGDDHLAVSYGGRAIGGSGDDDIEGTGAGWVLRGDAGTDDLAARGYFSGYNKMSGGDGTDQFIFSGLGGGGTDAGDLVHILDMNEGETITFQHVRESTGYEHDVTGFQDLTITEHTDGAQVWQMIDAGGLSIRVDGDLNLGAENFAFS